MVIYKNLTNETEIEAITDVNEGIPNTLKCKRCYQWIGYHSSFEFKCIQQIYSNYWIVNLDMTKSNFRKKIIGMKIFCDCGQYLGNKLNENRTLIIYNSLILTE